MSYKKFWTLQGIFRAESLPQSSIRSSLGYLGDMLKAVQTAPVERFSCPSIATSSFLSCSKLLSVQVCRAAE
jgi:hypothetical protein